MRQSTRPDAVAFRTQLSASLAGHWGGHRKRVERRGREGIERVR
jgi:hypothetical protein